MVSNDRKPSQISESPRGRGGAQAPLSLPLRSGRDAGALRRSSDANRKGGACTSMQVGTVNGVEAVEIDQQSQQLWQRQRQQHLGLLPRLLRVEDYGELL